MEMEQEELVKHEKTCSSVLRMAVVAVGVAHIIIRSYRKFLYFI
jgi:hypothetical protein